MLSVEVTVAPVIDDLGHQIALSLIVRDITSRKAMEEQLRQAQRMEAVGRLSGGVAHDFNNLLTAIIGHSDLLMSSVPAGDPRREDVDAIRKSADRAAALTRQLLAFSRKQILKPQIVDLNAVVENIKKLLGRIIGEDVDLIVHAAQNLGRVRIDIGQIEQVIVNLAVNARDAMPHGGRLTIETANVELDAGYTLRHPVAAPGPYVMLTITDTGLGMDAATQARVFEPFFTTKDQGKGTGLGLATVYGIVKQSGGYIWVYSEPGRGTAFRIYFPRREGAIVSAVRGRALEGVAREHAETILLVEDEELVRSLIRTILKTRGYHVLEAGQGEIALNVAAAFPEHIHVLLTDTIMPQMGGPELAERLLQLRPKTKVIYMSGFTRERIFQEGIFSLDTAFLQKPFPPDALLRMVRSVLEA